MSAAKHTPGPWRARPCACELSCKRWILLVPQNTEGRFDEADASLIAAAPDHALLLAAFARGDVRWEPFNLNARHPETPDRRGELCIGGMRYSTDLDENGCPIVHDVIRAALRAAVGQP